MQLCHTIYGSIRLRVFADGPRYHPDWKPSWIGTDINPRYMEDYILLLVRGFRQRDPVVLSCRFNSAVP